jgi:hypothetical protein
VLVVRYESIRVVLLLFAMAAAHNMEIMQFYVTAFLHGDLREEIYMEQPQGFVDDRHPNSVCCCRRAVQALLTQASIFFKKASRAWNVKFDNFLLQSGSSVATPIPVFISKLIQMKTC